MTHICLKVEAKKVPLSLNEIRHVFGGGGENGTGINADGNGTGVYADGNGTGRK